MEVCILMKLYFSDEEKEKDFNKFVLEEDDVLFSGEYIEGSGKSYVITGSAIIDEETYNDFQIEFELLKEPSEETIESIMNEEWDWYNYIC